MGWNVVLFCRAVRWVSAASSLEVRSSVRKGLSGTLGYIAPFGLFLGACGGLQRPGWLGAGAETHRRYSVP